MGIGESSLVVALHLVTLLAFVASASLWAPWIIHSFKRILQNPIGLLVIACSFFAVESAMSAAYYSFVRIFESAEIDMRAGGFAYLIVLFQAGTPIGLLLLVISHWRVDELPAQTIAARARCVFAAAIAVYLSSVWALW